MDYEILFSDEGCPALWQMRIKKRPFVLSHGITSSCNLRCRFCSYWRQPGPEMSTLRFSGCWMRQLIMA